MVFYTLTRGLFQRWESRAAERPAATSGAVPTLSRPGGVGPAKPLTGGVNERSADMPQAEGRGGMHAVTVPSGAGRGAVLWKWARGGGLWSRGGTGFQYGPHAESAGCVPQASAPTSALLMVFLHP